jgi:acyl-CoA synthetase (AMP-forming)/AMP-acid ligase II
VRYDTLRRFAETFEPCGFRWETFYPCYGLAEATLFATGRTRSDPPVIRTIQAKALELGQIRRPDGEEEATRTLVGCGQRPAGQGIVVVDPHTLTEQAPGRVGEIWLSGPSVADGYWNRPDDTESTFRARLADSGEGPFLRTGDLGFRDDGQLFVTGRLKDLIIVDGRNHYPQDVELSVEQCHPAIRPGACAAFSVDVDGSERVVVAAELNPRFQLLDRRSVVEAIRRVVSESHGLRLYDILLLKHGTIPVTSSGKIQRHACRAEYLAGLWDGMGELGGKPTHGGGRPRDLLQTTDA